VTDIGRIGWRADCEQPYNDTRGISYPSVAGGSMPASLRVRTRDDTRPPALAIGIEAMRSSCNTRTKGSING
jgi:hypothetical protein